MKIFFIKSFLFIFVVCLFSCSGSKKTDAEQLAWKVIPSVPAASGQLQQHGLAGAFTGVHQNVLLFAGGANFPEQKPWQGGVKKYWDDVYVLTRNKNDYQWKEKTFKLPFPVAYGVSISTAKGIFCIGGENESGLLSNVFLLQWDESKQDIRVESFPALPFPLTNASVALAGHTVYVVGGESTTGVTQSFLSFDLNSPDKGWLELTPLPVPVSHSFSVVQSGGKVAALYVIGGRAKKPAEKTDFYSSVYQYNLQEKKWKSLTSIVDDTGNKVSWSAGTGVAIGASYVLLFSGDNGVIASAIEELSLAAKDNIQQQQSLKDSLLSGHKGFENNVRLFNTITQAWTTIGESPMAQVTTQAVKWNDDILIISGEIKPGSRTAAAIVATVKQQRFFSWPDIIVLLGCFLLMTFVRYFFTRKQTGTNDYFKGGQRIPRWAAGISIFGAKLSAITFMGIPAKTYSEDWTYFFLLMSIIFIMPLVLYFFIPFYRRLNVTSAYEYLEKRFNYQARLFSSSLYVLFQLGRMSIVVLLPSIALTLVTGIDIYICVMVICIISIFFTVKGGIEAVIWVEVAQVLILAGGALFCLFYLPFQIKDYPAAWTSIQNMDKLKIFDLRMDFSEPVFWVVILGGLSLALFTYGADQTTVQRYLTTRDEKESAKSLKLGAWLTLPSTIVFFTIGTLLFLFFREQPQQVNIALESQDNIFPWFIVSQLPVGLTGLLIAGIFAAAMSSTEASMNSVATLLTTDFYKKWKPAVSDAQALFFARAVTLGVGLFVTAIALYMAHKGVSSLWDQFNLVMGLFTGTIGGLFMLGIFFKRANGTGALYGIACSILFQLFIKEYTTAHFLLYSFTGVISCIVFGYLFSLIFPRQSKDISGLTIHNK